MEKRLQIVTTALLSTPTKYNSPSSTLQVMSNVHVQGYYCREYETLVLLPSGVLYGPLGLIPGYEVIIYCIAALKYPDGPDIINGNWRLVNSNLYPAAGTEFLYNRGSGATKEQIRARGPTNQSVEIMVCPTVKHSYL